MAAPQPASTYTYHQGEYWVGEVLLHTVVLDYAQFSGEATRSQVAELEIPTDAVVDRAEFSIAATPGGVVSLASLGQVRAGEDATEVVVDLGGMTTLAGVSAGQTSIRRWNGVEFVAAGTGEIQTERLLLRFGDDVDHDAVGRLGTAVIPGVPTALELLIDGTTVWFERQGSTAGLTPPDAGVGVAFAVDRTTAMRDAFAVTGGPVRVELRAMTPGNLSLTPSIAVHRVHRVAFPEGPSRTIVRDAEGPVTVELPLPEGSTGWTVDAVDAVVSAAPGPERIVPADGPPPTADARLRLPVGRTVLARIPDALRAAATTITGVRIAVRGGTEGGELTGRMLAERPPTGAPAPVAGGGDTAGGEPGTIPRIPGDAVDGGELTPVLIEPRDEPRWVSLRTAAPVGADAEWLELGSSAGTLIWELTASGGDDPVSPGAPLHLRKAGGAIRPLPELDDVGPVLGSVRVIVAPDANRPIGAITLQLADQPGSAQAFTPRPDGTLVRLTADGAVNPSAGLVVLTGAVTAPATYTFADVFVTYREEM